MTVYESSIQDFAATSPGQYDLIASNPPFFSEITVSPHPERRLGRYAGALPPGALIDVVNQLLAPNGHCCLILPVTEGKRFCELAALKGLYYTRITEVQTIVGKPVERLLIQLEKSPYDFKRESLTIYQEREVYTEGFRRLTKDFYLGITNIE
jgi:tRNA1Val (adenine37-N6)-methyltransferase